MFFQKLLFHRYLDKKERLFYIIHQHWYTIKNQMIKIGLVGYAIPIALLIFVVGLFSPLSYFFYAWIAIAILYSIYTFLDWYLDAWLITDISIIDTAWDGFFKQRSNRIDYASIESISIEKKGIKQSLFNFGDIMVIKASGVNIKMESVSKPQIASSWLSRMQTEMKNAKNSQNAESIKNLLAEIIQEHINVNS